MASAANSPTATSRTAARSGPRPALLAPTYLRLDIRRVLRNRRAMIFTIALPGLLYLVFGATQAKGEPAGNGNAAFYVLVGMASYGAVLAASSNAAAAALEMQAGWTRTLMMTPLTPAGYVGTKVALALSMSALPVIVLAVVGGVSGASAPIGVWAACLLIAWVGSSVFAALGLAVGAAFRSDGAMQVIGGVLALLAFAGNVFVPLKGAMLTFAQFTPMFGVVSLARYPLDSGVTVYGTHIPLWVMLVNAVAWAAIFLGASAFFYARSGRRD